MHWSSEADAYRPAVHGAQVRSAVVLPPLRPSPAFEHAESQSAQALVDAVEKRPVAHSGRVVPLSLAGVSVTAPAAQAMQSLSEVAAY